jgi:hypothetical protein
MPTSFLFLLAQKKKHKKGAKLANSKIRPELTRSKGSASKPCSGPS